MWIKSIELENVRGISGAWEFLPGRVNVLSLGTGQGKTTLAHCILAGLYGPGTGNRVPTTGSVRIRVEKRPGEELLLVADFESGSWNCSASEGTIACASEAEAQRLWPVDRSAFEICCLGLGDNPHPLVSFFEELNNRQESSLVESVRKYGEKIAATAVFLPGWRERPLAETLSGYERELKAAAARVAALESARTRALADGAAAEGLKREAEQLAVRRSELELLLPFVELRELRSTVLRLQSGAANREERLARISQLRSQALEDISGTELVEQQAQDWEEAVERADKACVSLQDAERAVSAVQQPPASPILPGQLQTISDLKDQIVTARHALSKTENELRALDQEPEEEADLPAALESLLQKVESLSGAHREKLISIAEELRAVELRLAESERAAGETHQVVVRSRTEREKVAAISTASVAVAAVGSVAGIVLWMTALPMAATATGAVALALGAAGLEYAGRGKRRVASTLEPALADEVTLAATATRLRERKEQLQSDAARLVGRSGIALEEIPQLTALHEALEFRRPRYSAREKQRELVQHLRELEERALSLLPVPDSEQESGEAVATDPVDRLVALTDQLQQQILIQQQTEQSEARLEEAHREAGEAARLEDEAATALRNSLSAALPSSPVSHEEELPADSRRLLQEWVSRFREAVKLSRELQQLLLEEQSEASGEAAKQLEELKSRIHDLEERCSVAGAIPDEESFPGSLAQLQGEASLLERRASELRRRSNEAFRRGMTAYAQWQGDYSRLKSRLLLMEKTFGRLQEWSILLRQIEKQVHTLGENLPEEWLGEITDRTLELLRTMHPVPPRFRWPEDLLPSRDTALSSGTASQVQLALRLSTSEQLISQTGPVPLVLDDSMSCWDDQSFITGARWLVEYAAAGRQVLFFTSQQARLAEVERSDFETARELHTVGFSPV